MTTNMKFGECLRYLLSILDISNVKLSKAINIDASLTNRWVNEKRTPSYNTDYIEKISEYLSSCILNSFQIQHLDGLFLKVCGDNKIEINQKEKIKKILLQSQGYSIECGQKILKESKINTTSLNSHNTNSSINLSSEDKIIAGYKNILAASISLLEDSSRHECNNDVIYLSFNSNTRLSSHFYDLICFRSAILKAINNGWSILFLLKLNNNINDIIDFIDFAQPLIGTGKFHPYYFKKYDLFSTYEEFIVVPEIGTLLGLSNNPHSEIDTAFYFRNKVAVNIFKNKFNTMITKDTTPLVKYYKSDNAIDYSNYLTKNEDVIGNRILYKRDFSILMLPENLYNKLLQSEKLKSDEINTSLEFYKKRSKAFLSNISNYKYTDIYHIDCINTLIKYRKISLYLYNKVEEINLKVEDVIKLLKNIVTLLNKYENYNIAFISQDFNNTTQDPILYCMLKERSAVMVETYKYLKTTPEVRLSIEEPILVKAFEVYFNEILTQIAPMNKDKNEIIDWIQYQIDFLKNHD